MLEECVSIAFVSVLFEGEQNLNTCNWYDALKQNSFKPYLQQKLAQLFVKIFFVLYINCKFNNIGHGKLTHIVFFLKQRSNKKKYWEKRSQQVWHCICDSHHIVETIFHLIFQFNRFWVLCSKYDVTKINS